MNKFRPLDQLLNKKLPVTDEMLALSLKDGSFLILKHAKLKVEEEEISTIENLPTDFIHDILKFPYTSGAYVFQNLVYKGNTPYVKYRNKYLIPYRDAALFTFNISNKVYDYTPLHHHFRLERSPVKSEPHPAGFDIADYMPVRPQNLPQDADLILLSNLLNCTVKIEMAPTFIDYCENNPESKISLRNEKGESVKKQRLSRGEYQSGNNKIILKINQLYFRTEDLKVLEKIHAEQLRETEKISCVGLCQAWLQSGEAFPEPFRKPNYSNPLTVRQAFKKIINRYPARYRLLYSYYSLMSKQYLQSVLAHELKHALTNSAKERFFKHHLLSYRQKLTLDIQDERMAFVAEELSVWNQYRQTADISLLTENAKLSESDFATFLLMLPPEKRESVSPETAFKIIDRQWMKTLRPYYDKNQFNKNLELWTASHRTLETDSDNFNELMHEISHFQLWNPKTQSYDQIDFYPQMNNLTLNCEEEKFLKKFSDKKTPADLIPFLKDYLDAKGYND